MAHVQQASRNGHNSSSSAESENTHHILSDGDSGFIIENTKKEQNGGGVSDKDQASQDETIHTFEIMELSDVTAVSVMSTDKDGEIEMNDTGLTDISDVHVNMSVHGELTGEHSKTSLSSSFLSTP